MKQNLFAMIVACLALFAISCGNKSNQSSQLSDELSGAGATFPLSFYNVVFEEYATKNKTVTSYGAIGSGGGIRNLKDGVVDFAASDAFLTDEEIKTMPEVIHIPTCMGAVVLAYNLKGVENLNLSSEVIADIFAGNIRKWNDAKIKELNPQASLPDVEIIPVYRSDGSGTTFVFTDYLTKVSKEWETKYGRGKSVNFPIGLAAKGNTGVAGVISNTANTIGYIGSEYAFAQKIPYAGIKNLQGEIILPSTESISKAASGEIPQDTRCSITNSDAKGAYPISCFTWILVYKEQNYSKRDKLQAETTVNLLEYILSSEAQAIAKDVHYAPLPEKLIEQCQNNLKQITYDGVQIKK
ncbi:MAG: phosphate ABC transporter substrate-binding protein PstS [Bacteroidales bacterium]|nr:phosphate ABC transporter substrate-binding protein PstS [Bacteroidales bacterium]